MINESTCGQIIGFPWFKTMTKTAMRAFIRNDKLFVWGLVSFIIMVSIGLLQIPPRGLTVHYYANPEWRNTPAFSLREPQITLETQKQLSDYAEFPRTNFSIAWHGWLRIDRPGTYHFSTLSDDGSSLLIDETLVVENGGFHTIKEVSGEIFLEKGMHRLNINYFNGAQAAVLKVAWVTPQGTTTALPPEQLFSQRLTTLWTIVTRHHSLIFAIYLAAWIGLLVILSLRFGRKLCSAVHRRYSESLPVSIISNIIQGCLVLLAVIIIVSNLSHLVKNLPPYVPFPYKIAALRPLYSQTFGSLLLKRKLSAFFTTDREFLMGMKPTLQTLLGEWRLGEYRSAEATKRVFYGTIRYLYAGRTLFLPRQGLFNEQYLLRQGQLAEIRYYSSQQLPSLSENEIRRLPLYHRFIYNPYAYSPHDECPCPVGYDFIDCDNVCPSVDFSNYPVFLLLMQPTEKTRTDPSDIMVISCGGDHLCFIPQEQLPLEVKQAL
ncbi:hypothetical protein GF339_21255 [candidate division KSB3 bacterium]|uniref:PA14 domain-containing protein n=1 Tax=candidate division KSB3 bacterium TaxID=2044937 RepID=A0A9D5JZC0_9BACT|nr:hypothetical protein [candidate division KSB3 bacterium]MBD3327129.1 hypothetical protein [candidate division KSB3 bacterium]